MKPPPEIQAAGCPLCGLQMGKKAKTLYLGWVCRRCSNGFVNRRQFAYAFDSLTLFLVFFGIGHYFELATTLVGLPSTAVVAGSAEIAFSLLQNGMLFLKDGFGGKSPGRWLMGITVLNEQSREPIGFGQSFKRNLCLIVPFGVLVILIQMSKGWRWTDRWAQTRVVWDKYRHRFPFEDRANRCRKCGYDLFGNQSGICPECGEAIPQVPMASPAPQGAGATAMPPPPL